MSASHVERRSQIDEASRLMSSCLRLSSVRARLETMSAAELLAATEELQLAGITPLWSARGQRWTVGSIDRMTGRQYLGGGKTILDAYREALGHLIERRRERAEELLRAGRGAAA